MTHQKPTNNEAITEIVVLYLTLVQDGACLGGFEQEFSPLESVISSAAARDDRTNRPWTT